MLSSEFVIGGATAKLFYLQKAEIIFLMNTAMEDLVSGKGVVAIVITLRL